jgi:putative Mg2+ transporter-C (MgtC) family protein
VGILLGVGFYPAAILMAMLCAGSLSLLNRIEGRLPGRCSFEVELKFQTGVDPHLVDFEKGAIARGYEVQKHTLTVHYSDNQLVWRVNVAAMDRSLATSPAVLGRGLQHLGGIASFSIIPIRN